MSVSIRGLKSEVVAYGLVAACGVLNVPASSILTPGSLLGASPRRLTAAALLAAWPRKGMRDGATVAIAELLGVPKTDLAPSGKASAYTSDDLLTVVEAMRRAGLNPAGLEAVRGVRRSPRAPKPDPTPKAPRAPVQRTPVPAPAVQVRPMKANVRRWTRQFLNAGWSPREVAHLFDLRLAQLKAETVSGSAQ